MWDENCQWYNLVTKARVHSIDCNCLKGKLTLTTVCNLGYGWHVEGGFGERHFFSFLFLMHSESLWSASHMPSSGSPRQGECKPLPQFLEWRGAKPEGPQASTAGVQLGS